ncbi:hypothetical protein AB0G81_02060 [Streptomyces asoensis]|uniref:hypothetical protein n=1 Tax=Streptomyces asoensis TaxID=249586 RepID=UPI0033EC562C
MAAILALPVLLVAGLLVLIGVWVLSDDEETDGTRLKEVPCAEALAFGGARMPEGAGDAKCTVQSWLDTNYQADFRVPRAGFDSWLEDAYPQRAVPAPRRAPTARTTASSSTSPDAPVRTPGT